MERDRDCWPPDGAFWLLPPPPLTLHDTVHGVQAPHKDRTQSTGAGVGNGVGKGVGDGVGAAVGDAVGAGVGAVGGIKTKTIGWVLDLGGARKVVGVMCVCCGVGVLAWTVGACSS